MYCPIHIPAVWTLKRIVYMHSPRDSITYTILGCFYSFFNWIGADYWPQIRPRKNPDVCVCFSKVKLKAKLLFNVTQNIAEKQVGLFLVPV